MQKNYIKEKTSKIIKQNHSHTIPVVFFSPMDKKTPKPISQNPYQ